MDSESVPSEVSENKNVEARGTEFGQSKTQEQDVKKYLPWLHPTIALRDVPGFGKGLIATEFIPEGTVVWRDAEARQTWRFTDAEARGWPKEEYDDWCNYCYQVEDTVYTGTRIRKGEKRLLDRSEYTNHSCDPNTWQEIDDDSVMTARRDIKVGDEVTYDYCTSESENSKQVAQGWKCGCSTRECRGQLTGIEYKNNILQKKYERRWSPYLQKKIDKLNGKHTNNETNNNLLSTPASCSSTTTTTNTTFTLDPSVTTSSSTPTTPLSTSTSESSSAPTTPPSPNTPTSTNPNNEFSGEVVLVN